MNQIQLRYIMAGMLAAFFFVLIYGILEINLILTLVLTVVVYIGGTLIFKEKDIRELTPEHIDAYYFIASKCANQASLTEDVEIKEIVEKIATYTDEIIVSLSQRPKKVEQVFDFFDYYLDITNKILLRYNALAEKQTKTAKEKEFMDKTLEFLKKIESAFARQLENMQEARMLDIESDIRMFEKTVGLKKSDIEVGENDETK